MEIFSENFLYELSHSFNLQDKFRSALRLSNKSSQPSDSIPRDHLQVGAMLQENRAGGLLRVYSDASVCYYGGGRRVHLEFFRHELHTGNEGGFFWHRNTTVWGFYAWGYTYVLKGSLGSEAFVILKVTFCPNFFYWGWSAWLVVVVSWDGSCVVSII